MPNLGVFPVYNIGFKIGTAGRNSIEADMAIIADMESFSPSVDGSVEKWTPMDTAGWARALMTGKAFSISLKGKRNVGDKGNDYVAGLAWADGLNCSSKAEINFPDGAKLAFDCVVDVKTPFGGDSTNVSSLELDLVGDGKPNYTPAPAPAALALVTSEPAANAVGVDTAVHPALTFNNAIASYFSVVLLNETDNTIEEVTMTLDSTKKILTIVPTSALLSAKVYDIILSGVTDTYGQVLAQQLIKFTIA